MERSEQEVVISKCADEDRWTIYSTDPVYTRVFTGIAKHVDGEIKQHQGGTKIFLPKNALRFAAKRRRVLSDEDRAKLAATFRARLGRQALPPGDEVEHA